MTGLNLEIWESGNPGIWKSWNLEIWESGISPKREDSQNANSFCPNCVQGPDLQKNTSQLHLWTFETNFSMGQKITKIMIFAYFPWRSNGVLFTWFGVTGWCHAGLQGCGAAAGAGAAVRFALGLQCCSSMLQQGCSPACSAATLA